MSFSNGKKLAGAATVAAAIGLLIIPAPAAQSAPADCAGYQFPGGRVTIHYPNIGQAEFDTVAGGTHVDTRATTVYSGDNNMPGTVIGDINGNKIHLKITREGANRDYPAMILDGDVGPDNRGHGGYTYKGGDPGTWDSLEEMKCIPKPAAPPPAGEPEPVGPAPKPVPQELAAPPPPAEAPAPTEAAAPEQQGPCIPDPFDLNFAGAC
jgi:hypothetical protein